MSKIKLPVIWVRTGFVELEANTIEDAIKHFEDLDPLWSPMPDLTEAVYSSFDLTTNDPNRVALYNEGVPVKN